MKKLLFLYLNFWLFAANAQDFVIPFSENEKFGLMNNQKKVIVKPEFSSLEWKHDDYFIASKEIDVNDYLGLKSHTQFDQSNLKLLSLYKGGEIIIKDEFYREIEIVKGKFIIARYENDLYNLTVEQAKHFSKNIHFTLINLEGKKLIEKSAGFAPADSLGVSSVNPGFAKYILTFMFDENRRVSAFVFDVDKQEIVEWLFKEVSDFKIDAVNERKKFYHVSFIDLNGKGQNIKLDYSGLNYKILEQLDTDLQDEPEEKIIGIRDDSFGDRTNVSLVEGLSYTPKYGYFIEKDTLKFFGQREVKIIKKGEEVEFVFRNPTFKSQKESTLIYREKSKYGILKDGNFDEVRYDRVEYYQKNQFFVCNQIAEKWNCGTLNSDRKPIIPIGSYEEIVTFPHKLCRQYHSGKPSYIFSIKNYQGTAGFSGQRFEKDHLMVEKSGKMGVISNDNRILIPVEYDMIAIPEDFSYPLKVDYLILQRNGLFGTAIFEEGAYVINPIVFSDIPAYRIDNYYGIDGFSIYALYNQKVEFLGFSTKEGVMYVK